MYWILLIFFSVCLVPFVDGIVSLELLGLCYLTFAVMPAQQMVGAKFRSQHVMSRNYLLSLPIHRQTNFIYVMLRMLIYMLPLMILVFFIPKFEFMLWIFPANYLINNWHLFFLIPLGCVWFSCQQLHSVLAWETISSHLTSMQRFMAWVTVLFFYFLEFIVMAALVWCSSMPAYRGWSISPWVAVLLALAVCSFRVYQTRQHWLEL
jgi:hypothetical protein